LSSPSPNRFDSWLAAGATAAATIAWGFWYAAGLTLSHYDAKAHLVVARRIVDNLTPGWQQIGAVWLPLPHLINLLPTQVDVFYRTGLFASAVSVLCFAVIAWASARLIGRATGSSAGSVTAALLLALNPNLLYLHTTPMTEPLLLAVTFLLVLWLYEWLSAGQDAPVPWRLDLVLFLAAWTRYEAWLIIAAALSFTAVVRLRHGVTVVRAARTIARVSLGPALAVLLFVLNSRLTVGSWFVSSGFFVPDPTYQGLVARSALAIWWGTHEMSSYLVEIVALAAAAIALFRRDQLVVAVSLFATALLPFGAFIAGHPFRIRYMIPLVAASALFGGLAVGLLDQRLRTAGTRGRRGSPWPLIVAALLVGSLIVESPPWSGRHAPLIAEAEWDVPVSVERRAVTACLAAYHGEKILASMGSLAHYMQELAAHGFRISDFVNEGNGTLWDIAMSKGPAPFVGWMLVEEQAEGGDVLAARIRQDDSFTLGMARVCEGGGVALYRRTAAP
jgi:hypothetical protein